MTAYTTFSTLYEDFMSDAPYTEWMTWLQSHFPDLNRWSVADVGCGTGTLTRMLAETGARVVGVDLSEEMLGVAMQESFQSKVRVDWLCQDMTELRLPWPANLILSTCDAVSYVRSEADVKRTFHHIRDNLAPGGWFCFDILGEGRVKRLREGLSYDIRSDAVLLFESDVTDTGEVRYELTAFARQANGLYERISEEHVQKWYRIDWIEAELRGAGFHVHQVVGDFGLTTIEEATRVIIQAQLC